MAASTKALKELGAPTPADEVKRRTAPGGSGKTLSYIDARFVMDRLDSVVGPENWANEFVEVHGGIVCRIGINIEDTGWVWKSDVGTESTIEATKGNYSDAFKRAAVHWGIARDLYDDRTAPAKAPQAHAGATQRPASPAPAVPAPRRDEAVADWSCPTHRQSKVVPAGTSKTTGRAYAAFAACPIRGCEEKAPRGTSVARKANPVGFSMMGERDEDF